jgi:hypothetical protein
MKRTIVITALLLLSSILFARDMSTTLAAAGLSQAAPPQLRGNAVLWSYQFAGPNDRTRIHTVQIAFAHENYSQLYPFARNEQGVYVLVLDLPPELDELHYRLIVDGLWTPDPTNPDTFTDRWGIRVSRLRLDRPAPVPNYPVVRDESMVEFRFFAPPGQNVTIVGSFNGWDPFMTPMVETQPGVYRREVRLPPGDHLYYFLSDGLRIPDPENADRRWDVDGMIVSVVSLP